MGEVMKCLYKTFGITHLQISAYHPQTDAKCEHVHSRCATWSPNLLETSRRGGRIFWESRGDKLPNAFPRTSRHPGSRGGRLGRRYRQLRWSRQTLERRPLLDDTKVRQCQQWGQSRPFWRRSRRQLRQRDDAKDSGCFQGSCLGIGGQLG